MRVDGVRMATWSSQAGWRGLLTPSPAFIELRSLTGASAC
jgi:hypothetical protein